MFKRQDILHSNLSPYLSFSFSFTKYLTHSTMLLCIYLHLHQTFNSPSSNRSQTSLVFLLCKIKLFGKLFAALESCRDNHSVANAGMNVSSCKFYYFCTIHIATINECSTLIFQLYMILHVY